MPPKRRAPPASGKAAIAKAPAPRRSRLAKEHGCSAAHEAEIREAWKLFSASDPSSSTAKKKSGADDFDKTVISTRDVRRCLIALNAPPSSREEMAEIVDTLDPDSIGTVAWEHFFAIAALKIQSRLDEPEDDDEYEDGNADAGPAHAEVRSAFRLFTRDEGQAITLGHLRRVARELREDIDDKTLRDMIREANGSSASDQDTAVGIDAFTDVMKRAGVFS